MSLLSRLIWRRNLCQSLEYCSECQGDNYVVPIDCTREGAVERHANCLDRKGPSITQIKIALVFMSPNYPGLTRLVQNVISGHRLDVENNCNEWLREGEDVLNPRAIHKYLEKIITEEAEDYCYELLDDADFRGLCGCF